MQLSAPLTHGVMEKMALGLNIDDRPCWTEAPFNATSITATTWTPCHAHRWLTNVINQPRPPRKKTKPQLTHFEQYSRTLLTASQIIKCLDVRPLALRFLRSLVGVTLAAQVDVCGGVSGEEFQ